MTSQESAHKSRPRISVLLTCHQRRATTLRCLDLLASQQTSVDMQTILVDASSRDGTADAVRDAHPDTIVESVSDDVFWNGGMHRAWSIAMELGFDAHLWLNDDTSLDPDAVQRLVQVWMGQSSDGNGGEAIVVGSTRDPESGSLTYGGVVRPSMRRPLKYELVTPAATPVAAETMNGNLVLVPDSVAKRIGILDPGFTHGMGDYDYGHRAVAAGIAVLVAPGTYGTCPRNAPDEPQRSVRDEVRALRRPTGLPPSDFARYARRWAGPLWPVYWASPYVRRITRLLRG